MEPYVAALPLEKVGTFIINEIEGEALCTAAQPDQIIAAMRTRFPRAACILTLGRKGACYADSAQFFSIPACKVTAVDTTAAGDTFIGYYLAGLQKGLTVREALQLATKAAALSVTKQGAASSIPYLHEVNMAKL
jgi:ribokinase